MKNADLHCSYSAPVLVSVDAVTCDVAAARAETVFVCGVALRDTGVLVAEVFLAVRDDKIETDFALRGATVVFTAFLDVVERVLFSEVTMFVFLPRDAVFSPRDAASALNMQTTVANIKHRIFFIS